MKNIIKSLFSGRDKNVVEILARQDEIATQLDERSRTLDKQVIRLTKELFFIDDTKVDEIIDLSAYINEANEEAAVARRAADEIRLFQKKNINVCWKPVARQNSY